jgi:hypothetical protein
MTHETDAMDARRLAAIEDAKAELNALDKNIYRLRGYAKTLAAKRADALWVRIRNLKSEIDEPETDAFELNSRGNVEGGMMACEVE